MMNRNANPSYSQRRRDQREDHLWKQDVSLSQQADKVRWSIPDAVRSEEEKLGREFDAMVSAETRKTQTKLADVLSETVRQFTGGVSGAVTVSHWKTPALTDLDKDEPPAGPLLSITPTSVTAWVHAVREQNPPQLSTPSGQRWVVESQKAIEETKSRYPVLPSLTDNARSARMFGSIGMTREVTTEEKVDGYGEDHIVKRKRTVVHVPSLIRAEVTPDGLQLTYAHREGDSAETWKPKTPALASIFKAQGVAADNLKVVSDRDGNVVLDFDDAPSGFPKAIGPDAPEHPAPTTVSDAADRYRKTRWVLGVDRRGREVSLPCEDYQHILVTGETGGGKSVWVRTQIEAMRAGGWTVYILDGKGSDYVSMRDLPGVGMVAPRSDLDLCVWMIHTVRREMDRRVAEAARKKEQRDPRAYEFPPILLLIDEWGLTATALRAKYGKVAESVFEDVDAILRAGREPRVHVALASQNIRKQGAASVPGSWFVNFKVIVSLGNPDSETIQSAFPKSLHERAGEVGPRIRGLKGRGMFADLDRERVSEFQSFYGWSPGTTSLDPNASASVLPPTDQVRESWEAWEPISASVPVLSPRIGVLAESPEWRESVDTIHSTPAVALTDTRGDYLEATRRFDPFGGRWVGAEEVDTSTPSIALVGFEDTPEPRSETVEPERNTPSPAADPEVTLADAVEEAERRGLITDDSVTLADAMENAVKKVARERGLLDEVVEQSTADRVRQKAIEMGLLDPDNEKE
ncbi:FtsK/SpoIIIE domain-containing protein [Mycobacteroides abscessus subsp. abscessus]|uniref:FtsK/SpoIIIE domain-containing protein n=1 Tax=Mycobacteroides abscessus TaxID=36809 RepID=UPI0019CFEE49|nr:FtsK/SpoIIIE domain-containing protein [Mycobacteroides abscessus]MDO3240518.1 FtsK/SpoIIIE domain-containing protein [Mycobacteroides abscessus subsp. abscessus]